ncbi:MAG: hypothetical protein ACRDC4_03555, partial [Plesiomonas sp.]
MTEEMLTANTADTEDTNQTMVTAINDTIPQRTKRMALTRMAVMRGPKEDTVSVAEGDSVSFECNPYQRNCESCGGRHYHGEQYGPAYFCQDPCGWGEVKAYTYPPAYGTDARFRVVKKSTFGNNQEGMVVQVRGVKATDDGKYYCGIDRDGKDWYEALIVRVRKPTPTPTPVPEQRPTIPSININTPSWEETAWMGNGEAEKGAKPEVQEAMMRCQGNKACTLALLQKQELEISTSCWICLQMSHAYTVEPLTVETMNETDCLIPSQMTEILRIARDIERG